MSKKRSFISDSIESNKQYTLSDAISIIKKHSTVKFDETLDIAVNLGVDPKQSSQAVRGMVSLPSGIGKSVKVAVICKDTHVARAQEYGADLAGSDVIIDDIKLGKIAFDVCIAMPDMMGVVGQVARILGPKGLMPNPKLGTITSDIKTAITNAKNGQVEYRVEKAGIVHAGLGKLSFTVDALLLNVNGFLASVVKSKPVGLKGTYLRGVYLSSTMGISVRIDLSTISY